MVPRARLRPLGRARFQFYGDRWRKAMTEALEKIRQETLARLQAARDGAELDEINVSILGRNGALTGILRGMGQLSKDERAKLGQAANTVKKELEAELAKR